VSAVATTRPPLWRDARVLRWAFQLAVLGVVLLIVSTLWNNVRANSERLGIPTDYGYLDNPAQFPIPNSSFRQTQPVADAIYVGLLNTARVSAVGILFATVLGTAIGVARLSGNWLVRTAGRVYVETIRNVPLLLLVVFGYTGVALATFPRIDEAWEPLGLFVVANRGVAVPWYRGSGWAVLAVIAAAVAAGWAVARWRRRVADRTGATPRTGVWAGPVVAAILAGGWVVAGLDVTVPELENRRVFGGFGMSPEFFAIFAALVVYTSSHIAEIVRGSIQAVPRGQGEAAFALALSPFQRLWYVVLPQAFRIAVPPLGNQFLNLTKNSTLGAVVSYYELAQVTSISVGNGAPAVPSYLLTLGLFVALSLGLSAMVNVVNRRLALVDQ
jgi:general L-amino acid transport system permease protein